jgi:hypothetical protein
MAWIHSRTHSLYFNIRKIFTLLRDHETRRPTFDQQQQARPKNSTRPTGLPSSRPGFTTARHRAQSRLASDQESLRGAQPRDLILGSERDIGRRYHTTYQGMISHDLVEFLRKVEKNINCFAIDDRFLCERGYPRTTQSQFCRSHTQSETPIILPFPGLGDSCPTRKAPRSEAGQAGIGILRARRYCSPSQRLPPSTG